MKLSIYGRDTIPTIITVWETIACHAIVCEEVIHSFRIVGGAVLNGGGKEAWAALTELMFNPVRIGDRI